MIKRNKINRKNKIGLSGAVVTVLLIVMGVLAVGIIGIFVLNFTKSVDFSPETSCFNLDTKKEIVIARACYNSESNEIEIILNRISDDIDFDNIYFLIGKDIRTEGKWCCGDDCDSCGILGQGSKKYYFDVSEFDVENLKNVKLTGFDCFLDEKEIVNC